MFIIPLILAAGSLPLISGLPVPSLLSDLVEKASSSHFLQERATSSYTVYGGNGEPSDGWPSMSDWVSSFETMFENNKPILQGSCAQFGVPDNTDDEINDMSSSIQSVASSTGIDARFIFAIILQESNGCVRAPTTNYGVRNPGLMQSHNGAGTCNDGSVQDPCPVSEITQMITDGSAGTASGDGLKQCLAESGATDVSMYYKAARIYNSGSVAASGNLGGGIATACYATDIANRLTGWFSGPSSCDASTIADLTGTPTQVSQGSSSGNDGPATTAAAQPAPVETTAPAVVVSVAQTTIAPSSVVAAPTQKPNPPSNTVVSVTTPTASPSPLSSSLTIPANPPSDPSSSKSSTSSSTTDGGISSPAPGVPVYSGAISTCQEYYTVQPGDYCIIVEQKFGISLDQLISWNSGLDEACSNLWLAYQYCVKA